MVIERPFLWLEANAGSGKTEFLANRVLSLLKAGEAPESILCLTYTHIGASEIRERILQKIENEIRDNAEGNELLRALYLEEFWRLSAMRICTIHSFGESLLRLFPYEAGVSPSFSILDAQEDEKLREGLVVQLQEWKEKTERLGQWPVRTLPIDEAFQALFDLYQSEQNFKTEILGALTQTLTQENLVRILKNYESWEAVEHAYKVSIGLQDETEESLQSSLRATFNLEFWNEILTTLKREHAALKSKTSQTQLDDLAHLVGEPTVVKLTRFFLKSDGGLPAKHFNQDVAMILTEGQKQKWHEMAVYVHDYLSQIEQLKVMKKSSQALLVMLVLNDMYRRAQEERNAFTFNELLMRVQLFTKSPHFGALLEHLDARIHHLLIDESQDTSPQQWDIIHALIESLVENTARISKTVCVVGDAKQSIFSFQGARLSTLSDEKKRLEIFLDQYDLKLETHYLVKSYRTGPLILEFVNALQKHLFKVSHEHVPSEKTENLWGSIQVYPHFEAEKSERLYAQKIAEEVAHLHRDVGLEWKDFLILVRRRQPQLIFALEAEMARAGIPFSVQNVLFFMDVPIVKELMSALQMALTPQDDFALAYFLRSSFVQMSQEALLELAQTEGKTLIEKLEKQRELHPKAWQAFETVLLTHYQTSSVALFFTTLVEKFNLSQRWAPHYESDQIKWVERFLLEADQWSLIHPLEKTGFYEFITNLTTMPKSPQVASDRQVQCLTVHGAKGLGARAVFVIDTVFSLREDRILWSSQTGLLWMSRTGLTDPEKQTLDHEKLAEENRLLYVAITRAKEYLRIFGYGKVTKNSYNHHAILSETLASREDVTRTSMHWGEDDQDSEILICQS